MRCQELMHRHWMIIDGADRSMIRLLRTGDRIDLIDRIDVWVSGYCLEDSISVGVA